MQNKIEKNNQSQKSDNFNFLVMSREDIARFWESFSMLIGSGMSINASLESIIFEAKSKYVKGIISRIKEDIENGYPLHKSLENRLIFKSNTISLIRIGEESGRLLENLKIVSEQDQKELNFRSKISSAMMYPIFVLIVTLVVGIGVSWFILPKLSSVFSKMNTELPTITQFLINSGKFFQESGATVIPIFIVSLIIFLYVLFFYKKTKFIGQSFLLGLPGIKNIIIQVELARFGFLFGTMLNAGVPILSSLESLSKSCDFHQYKNFYDHCLKEISQGNSFSNIFSNYKGIDKIMPHGIRQMIIAGEQSGNLPSILIKIGENYETKIDDSSENLATLLEPILLVLVWLGVMFVAIAVILPIYSLIGNLNKNISRQNNPIISPATQQLEITTSTEQIQDLINTDQESQTEENFTIPDKSNATSVNNINNQENIGQEVKGVLINNNELELIRIKEIFEYVDIKSKPEISSETIGRVYGKDEYEIIKENQYWYEIGFDEKKGWIEKDMVNIIYD